MLRFLFLLGLSLSAKNRKFPCLFSSDHNLGPKAHHKVLNTQFKNSISRLMRFVSWKTLINYIGN